MSEGNPDGCLLRLAAGGIEQIGFFVLIFSEQILKSAKYFSSCRLLTMKAGKRI